MGIAEVTAETGLDARVLRAWESRHGFPAPHRLANGRRAYRSEDVEKLREIVRLRESGFSLTVSIERVQRPPAEESPTSIYAGMRLRRPDLRPHVLPKRVLVRLSRAIEDEYCATAERGAIFGSFQEERYYRGAEERWRDMNRTAQTSVVFADFDVASAPQGAPAEIPIDTDDAMSREWVVICDAPARSACLVATERPGQAGTADRDRVFETVWSVEPEVTRAASRTALGLAERLAPDLLGAQPAWLSELAPASPPQLRALTALTNRMLAYVREGDV